MWIAYIINKQRVSAIVYFSTRFVSGIFCAWKAADGRGHDEPDELKIKGILPDETEMKCRLLSAEYWIPYGRNEQNDCLFIFAFGKYKMYVWFHGIRQSSALSKHASMLKTPYTYRKRPNLSNQIYEAIQYEQQQKLHSPIRIELTSPRICERWTEIYTHIV